MAVNIHVSCLRNKLEGYGWKIHQQDAQNIHQAVLIKFSGLESERPDLGRGRAAIDW